MRNLGPAIASRRRVLHAATPEPSQPSRSSLLPLANAGSSLLHTLKLSLTSQYSETGSGLRANTKRRKSPGLEIRTSVTLLVEFINILIFFLHWFKKYSFKKGRNPPKKLFDRRIDRLFLYFM